MMNGIWITLEPEELEVDIGLELGTLIPGGGGIPYEGPYQVTPKTHEQTLFTRDMTMEDDVTVFEIPYSSVSNPQGGETVNIAFD